MTVAKQLRETINLPAHRLMENILLESRLCQLKLQNESSTYCDSKSRGILSLTVAFCGGTEVDVFPSPLTRFETRPQHTIYSALEGTATRLK